MRLLAEGQQVRGNYEVERFLGEGAFAEVYRVRHRFLGRQAMKVFKMVGITAEETEQLLGEAFMLSRIEHRNIVRVYEADVIETARGTCGFFTMEYVGGGSLDQFWRSHGSRYVPVETAVEIMQQVCRGLAIAHSSAPPIVHRDIKPQNILVGYDDHGLRARVSDFGLAKRVNPLTLLATTRGTLAFKAPEALQDLSSDSCAGDVWALATTLYLLLTDRLPYTDEGGMQRLQSPMIPAGRLNAEVDAQLDQILVKGLSVDPANRYASAGAFLAALGEWNPNARAGSEDAPSGLSDVGKSVLGVASPADEVQAKTMVAAAMLLAKRDGNLAEAADLLEEAFNRWPRLREEYASRLQLWRRGVAM